MANSTRRFLVPEVADRLRMSVEKVLRLIRNRQLRAIDVSTTPGTTRPRYIIDEADLVAFEQARATAPAQTPAARRRRTTEVPNYFAEN